AGTASDSAIVSGTPGSSGGAPDVTISVVEGQYDAQVTASWQPPSGGTVTGWLVRGRLNGQVVQEATLPATERSSTGTLPRTTSPQQIEICVQAVASAPGPEGCAKATIAALQDGGSGGSPSNPPPPPPSGSLRQNEPAGLTFYAEHTMDGIPSPGSPGRLGAGARWAAPESTQRMQVVPSTAPAGGPNALRVQWQQGLQGGTYPHAFTLEHAPSREVYVSMYINFLGARSGSGFSCRFENHPVQTKWFYWMYQGDGTGHLGGRTTDDAWSPNPVNASKFWLSWQWTDGRATQETVPVHFDWNVCQWYHLEMHLVASDPGQNNGRIRIWVNGQLITDRAANTSAPGSSASRYDTFTWRPVWGGLGNTKTRDDYADIAYIYVSGR
ncbi:MAG TPA: hypothetical protein VNZ57_09640, partial [Longimicrobiales bacterium]|nr:hypothetical protein [Longimicrobiales bacterium]